jgi:hypothetical protein
MRIVVILPVAHGGTCGGRWWQIFLRSKYLYLVDLILVLYFQNTVRERQDTCSASNGAWQHEIIGQERQETLKTFVEGHKKVALIPY